MIGIYVDIYLTNKTLNSSIMGLTVVSLNKNVNHVFSAELNSYSTHNMDDEGIALESTFVYVNSVSQLPYFESEAIKGIDSCGFIKGNMMEVAEALNKWIRKHFIDCEKNPINLMYKGNPIKVVQFEKMAYEFGLDDIINVDGIHFDSIIKTIHSENITKFLDDTSHQRIANVVLTKSAYNKIIEIIK